MDSMIRPILEKWILQRRCTLLGVGPMSKLCVDATIELANENRIPMLLIASRRQIDSEELGGGYVNRWTTQQFADYVLEKDKNGRIILARDHGGPWQNEREKAADLGLRKAMESAKRSYMCDIDAGFQILHIDPSVDPHGAPTLEETLERMFELYEFCWSYARRTGREIFFEVGTEEQSGSTNTPAELKYTLAKVQEFCRHNKLPLPTFVVIQTGTRVMEMRNVGSFASPIRVAEELAAEIQVPMMIDICRGHGVFMKQHNTDYLDDESLRWHPRLGIHAANVAPEFGVAETRALLDTLNRHGLGRLADRFAALALKSGKWKKWLLPNSRATDLDRAVISGHYVFATEEGEQLKVEASAELRSRGIDDLDTTLKTAVKASIMRYLHDFRLVPRT
jgi:hypothetical protein